MSRAFGLPESFHSPVAFEQDAPGVDVIGVVDDPFAELSPTTRRLIGTLHRRMWKRCAEVRREGSLSLYHPDEQAPIAVDYHVDISESMSWSDRARAFEALTEHAEGDVRVAVRLRGWHETESNVLVDGLAVPGCIVDLAAVLTTFVEDLRSGEARLVISPADVGAEEAELWHDLLALAQDRLGVARGTVVIAQSTAQSTEVAAVA